MATSKKTIVASPKKSVAVVRAVKSPKNSVAKKRAPKKKVFKDEAEEKVNLDSETVIAPPLKVKKAAKEEVQIPANVSLRSQSKAQALTDLIEHLEQPFFVIAYVGAACFFSKKKQPAALFRLRKSRVFAPK